MRAAVLSILLAAPVLAHAGLYRWVDERGVTHYSDRRPEGVKDVRQVDEAAARVSTIPAPPPAERERLRARALEARVERLEREIEALERAAAAAPPVVVAMPTYPPAHPFAGPAFWPAYGFPLAYQRFRPTPRFHGGFRPPVGRPPGPRR